MTIRQWSIALVLALWLFANWLILTDDNRPNGILVFFYIMFSGLVTLVAIAALAGEKEDATSKSNS